MEAVPPGVEGALAGSATAPNRRKPTAASQVATLIQALQNGDAGVLDEVLLVQDAGTIASTVARLPMTSVLPFLEAVLQRVQGKPARVTSSRPGCAPSLPSMRATSWRALSSSPC